MRILEIGSGRNYQKWLNYCNDDITCVDRIFNDMDTSDLPANLTLIGKDLLPYLENYTGQDFNQVYAHRVMEHIPPDTIPYVLYLIRQISRPGGELEIIVPDFKMVIEQLDIVDPNTATAIKFNRMMIMAHTEIFNEPSDPHLAIWTEKMARYYLELEGYWTDIDIGHTSLDERAWYLKISARRR